MTAIEGIRLYQIAYDDASAIASDPAFSIFDCRDDPAPERRETHHMLRFFRAGRHLAADYSGLFSPKFGEKCRKSGRDFQDFIAANPGHDVYFINPFPQLAYVAYNIWEHGEQCHSGLLPLAERLFAAAGLPADLHNFPRQSAGTLLFCNFWVGNATFWTEFMGFVARLAEAVDRLSEIDRRMIFEDAQHSTPAPYYAFIFERLFSSFLIRRPDIRALAFPHDRAAIAASCETAMERTILARFGDLVDGWDKEEGEIDRQRPIFAGLAKISEQFAATRHRLRPPTDPTGRDDLAAAAFLLRENRLDEAHAACREILEAEPKNPGALAMMGACANKRGQYVWGERFADAAIALKEDEAGFHLEKARAVAGLGRVAAAVRSARRAIELSPDLTEAYRLIAGQLMPGEDYLAVLKRFHDHLAPRAYFEVGVAEGASLSLARSPTLAVGVDPAPHLLNPLKAPTKIFTSTSDAYFAGRDLAADVESDQPDLVFLDGSHLFEQTLRDFINVERFCGPKTVLLLHDCIPFDPVTASRERTTDFWTGDVWKVTDILRKWRGDLKIFLIPTPPTGLTVVTGLDRRSTRLAENFDAIVAAAMDQPMDSDVYRLRQDGDRLNLVANDWAAIRAMLDR